MITGVNPEKVDFEARQGGKELMQYKGELNRKRSAEFEI